MTIDHPDRGKLLGCILTGPDIKYNEENRRLEEVLKSIKRSGDYFAEGRLDTPPPSMTVDPVGTIAFPILNSQVRSLIETAKRAPYGRGPVTIVDTSVRDCWQIEAGDVRFGGSRWKETLSSILERVAEGLGLPNDQVSARLYKLLVYERGGFFSDHRDTEKLDGMVATLVISLPVDGEGGELVIRHKNREAVVDMCVQDPGELAFAAFYADCVHLTKPVRSGHRVSLVYNVVVNPGSRFVPARSPDASSQAEEAGRILADWATGEGSPRKLVWLLEHEYSEAGLCFESLKGIDASVGRTLARAAEIAGCALHLAILSIYEEGAPDYDNVYSGRWGDEPDDSAPMEEVFDGLYTLLGWVASDGEVKPDFPGIPLRDGEALPAGALDDVEPEEQTLTEATGNEGVSLERSYRWAALVIWPKSKAVPAIADGSISGAVNYVAGELEGVTASHSKRSLAIGLITQLFDAWPEANPYQEPEQFMEQGGDNIRKVMGILSEIDDEEQTARFLDVVVAKQYHEDLNDSVISAVESVEPARLVTFILELVKNNAPAHLGGVLNLLLRLDERLASRDPGSWRNLLRTGAECAFEALPQVLTEPAKDPYARWRAKPIALDSGAVRDLFLATQRFDLGREADEAAALIARRPRSVDPCRALPEALKEVHCRVKPLSDTPAIVSLWRYASGQLLARSGSAPPGREDQSMEAPIECDCEHCLRLRAFCLDPDTSVLRYPVRKEIRTHLRDEIRHAEVALKCETERRGRPYTLVCQKTPSGYAKRVKRYTADIDCIRLLIAAAPGIDLAGIAKTLGLLKAAVSCSR